LALIVRVLARRVATNRAYICTKHSRVAWFMFD